MMSVSSVAMPFRKRSNMLSFEGSRRDLLLERSRSRIDPFTTAQNNPVKSATLGRLVSSEGLDLGLPGIYRAKCDDDLIALHLRQKGAGHFKEGNSALKKKKTTWSSGVADDRPDNEKAMIFKDRSAISISPPPKPPRTKVRRSRGTEVDSFLFDAPLSGEARNDLPPPLKPNKSWASLSSSQRPPRPPAPVIAEEDDNVFLEPINDGDKLKPPVYATLQKFRRKSKEKILSGERLKKPQPVKKNDKFWRTFSGTKQSRREQLKASMSMPFEFRKISLGAMIEAEPIDLISSQATAKNVQDPTVLARNLHDLPDLPLRGYEDDGEVFCGVQGPDLLSHINTAKRRTLSNNPSEMRKYQTMGARSKPTENTARKGSWFSRRLSHRKSSCSEAPVTDSAEFLLSVGRKITTGGDVISTHLSISRPNVEMVSYATHGRHLTMEYYSIQYMA